MTVYWLVIAIIVAIMFLASNFAGPSGTPIFYGPATETLALGIVIYLLGLIIFRRRKKL